MLFNTLALLLAVLAPAPRPAESVLVDRVVARVNSEIITLSDVQKAVVFFPLFRAVSESEDAFFERILADMINYKVVYLEYSGEFALTDDDYEQLQTPLVKKLGSFDLLLELLHNYGMEWDDFRGFMRERVLFEKVLREKFQFNIVVPYEEIERFYQAEYLPMQKQLNIEPKNVVEMAPLIERYLRKIRAEERLGGWLSDLKSSYLIENKLRSAHEPVR